jgi:hypothetical protein
MVNTYRKGNRAELEARRICEKDGAITWKPSRAKWQNNDIFGLFDFVALYPGDKFTEIRFIQVKSTRSDFSKAKKEITAWTKKYNIKPPIWCEVWFREGPDSFEAYIVDSNLVDTVFNKLYSK